MGGCLQQEEKTPVQILKPKMPYFCPSQIWTPEMKMILSFTFIYVVCMCACACTSHASVKIRRTTCGSMFCPSTYVPQGLTSDSQPWQQAPLPTEP